MEDANLRGGTSPASLLIALGLIMGGWALGAQIKRRGLAIVI